MDNWIQVGEKRRIGWHVVQIAAAQAMRCVITRPIGDAATPSDAPPDSEKLVVDVVGIAMVWTETCGPEGATYHKIPGSESRDVDMLVTFEHQIVPLSIYLLATKREVARIGWY